MNQGELRTYFENNQGKRIAKWLHYFEVYERHLERFRGKPVNILEIGVNQGGSLQMWKHYFGEQAMIYGVDVKPRCKALEEERVKIFIGSQADRKFLREIKKEIPKMDILIDDGGHRMNQQIVTFEELFPHINDTGVYICEDLHTSYWPKYGGSYKAKNTFIEYSKNYIDQLNAWHTREPKLFQVDDFTRTAHSMHYYDSMLVIEKRPIKKPMVKKTGETIFPDL